MAVHGSGLTSMPQTRSSKALCSARTPVNSMPLSRSSHKKQRTWRIQAVQLAEGERAPGMTAASLLWPMLQRAAELGERVNIEYAIEHQLIAIAANGKPRRRQRGDVGWHGRTFAQTAVAAQVAGQLSLISALRITGILA